MTGLLTRIRVGLRLARDYDELIALAQSIERAAAELTGMKDATPSRTDVLGALRVARECLDELAGVAATRTPVLPEWAQEPEHESEPPEPVATEPSGATTEQPHPEPSKPPQRELPGPSPAVMDLIGVRDMLLMAADSDGAHGRGTFELLHRRLGAALEKEGLRLIETEGARFDPAAQEILDVRPTADPGRDGIVCATVRPGYAIGDRILRVQQVVVYRHKEGVGDAR